MAISARPRTRAEQESNVIRFFRETIAELRKVVWPTLPELYRYTFVVVVTVTVIALFIFAVDSAVGGVFTKYLYGKAG